MKLLLDAQLPRRLTRELTAAGHDAVHALDLPAGNRTTDAEIVSRAASEARIVVTKDSDFVATFLLRRLPPKLLLISTGNISNDELWALFAANLPAIESALGKSDFVELSRTSITVHV